jgi:hypothetical protein
MRIRRWPLVLVPLGRGAISLILACLATAAQGSDTLTFPQRASIPPVALEALRKSGIESKYGPCACLNPFYQRGDFDGDGRPDLAITVREAATGKVGILFLLSSRADPTVVGAGRVLGSGGDNFDWMDAWYVLERAPAKVSSSKQTEGDALWVEKTESASGLIRWSGKGFVWEQRGD